MRGPPPLTVYLDDGRFPGAARQLYRRELLQEDAAATSAHRTSAASLSPTTPSFSLSLSAFIVFILFIKSEVGVREPLVDAARLPLVCCRRSPKRTESVGTLVAGLDIVDIKQT